MANTARSNCVAPIKARWLSGPRLASGAGTRAEAAAIGALLVDIGHEHGGAVLTAASLATQTGSILADDKNLVTSDGALRVENVAPLAGRGEVFDGVVQRVPVEMVDDEDTLTAPAAWGPLHGYSTVVARVGSSTDFPVEDYTILRYERSVQRKWMIRRVDHPTSGRLSSAATGVSAFLGAVLTTLAWNALELSATVGARTRGPQLQPVRGALFRTVDLPPPAGPVNEVHSALTACCGSPLSSAFASTGRGAETPEFARAAASVFGAAMIAVSRSRRHA